MIRLAPCSPAHRPFLDALLLPDEQARFTALPKDILDDIEGDADRLAVTILVDDEPAGLFVLSVGAHRDKYLAEPDEEAVALGALSIDRPRQGRGVATAAMRLLADFVPPHFPRARRVLLVVNQANPAARRVYEKAGFEVTGARQGPVGPQWIMHLDLPLPGTSAP